MTSAHVGRTASGRDFVRVCLHFIKDIKTVTYRGFQLRRQASAIPGTSETGFERAVVGIYAKIERKYFAINLLFTG